ncbi:hypothetical protein [Bacillus wiedmannii]|uniref:hypothetical protein n=1 Tax=Bacillus wiedmannii TaxID=1890302 RepID=UPI000BEF44F0|nr:hypothetical protein [Bacillus wiedmannii]PEI77432.1 hypothetical protein CN905_15575 [Bacillus wiedmannii]
MKLIYVLMEDEGHDWGVVSASDDIGKVLDKQRKTIEESRRNAEYLNWSTETKDCDHTWITAFKDGEEMSSFKYDYEKDKFVVADSYYTQGKRNEEVESYVLPLLNFENI